MSLLSTMAWVYLAIGLLLVLAGLLIAPYFGVYGTKEPASIESTTTEESNLEDEQSAMN
jgi:hypothetical protein